MPSETGSTNEDAPLNPITIHKEDSSDESTNLPETKPEEQPYKDSNKCSLRLFYEPATNDNKPFRFKALQVGAEYNSIVLLFDTDDLLGFIPKLKKYAPQIAKFEKVVLKVYDRTELEAKYWQEVRDGDLRNFELDEYFQEYRDIFHQETRAMRKIMRYNSTVDDDKDKIRIPELLCYGKLDFDTYVMEYGPCDMMGDFLITEYLEPDEGVNGYRKGDYGGYVKMNESLYNEGVAQLNIMRKLGIVHDDLENGRNLLIKDGHLYFLDFGLSSFVKDDGSEESNELFESQMQKFSWFYKKEVPETSSSTG